MVVGGRKMGEIVAIAAVSGNSTPTAGIGPGKLEAGKFRDNT